VAIIFRNRTRIGLMAAIVAASPAATLAGLQACGGLPAPPAEVPLPDALEALLTADASMSPLGNGSSALDARATLDVSRVDAPTTDAAHDDSAAAPARPANEAGASTTPDATAPGTGKKHNGKATPKHDGAGRLDSGVEQPAQK
jgi:hypothetical protein